MQALHVPIVSTLIHNFVTSADTLVVFAIRLCLSEEDCIQKRCRFAENG